jgi:hypothetical protein
LVVELIAPQARRVEELREKTREQNCEYYKLQELIEYIGLEVKQLSS